MHFECKKRYGMKLIKSKNLIISAEREENYQYINGNCNQEGKFKFYCPSKLWQLIYLKCMSLNHVRFSDVYEL